MHAADYNPAQQEVVSLLGAPKGDRPTFDASLRDELRSLVEERLEPLVSTINSDRFDDDVLYLSKYMLTQALGCERKFMAELAEPFQWSIPTARGTVTHKAIELSVHWRGEASPLELVDEAMARLENADKSIADLPGALRRDGAGRAEGRGRRGHDPVPGVLPPAQAQMEAHDGQPDKGGTPRRVDRAVGQARPDARPT